LKTCLLGFTPLPIYRPAAFKNLSNGLAGGNLKDRSSLDVESLRRM
jgi:hypothetical protein